MKFRHFPLLLLTLVCLSFALLPVSVLAASAELTGPGEVRAGDSVTLTFSLPGDGALGVTGKLVYDENQVTLQKIDNLMPAPWVLESAGNVVIAYDNDQTSPLAAEETLFSLTFRVREGAQEGAKLEIGFSDITLSDGAREWELPTAVYTAAVGAPRSGDASLSALSLAGGTLQPTFDPDVREYSASVPFSVEWAELTPETADAEASYRISGQSLAVGINTVAIRVTAENGATRTYTIQVTRAQDPNYVPSGDAAFADIALSAGTLSPLFSPEVTEYVLYLPYETETLLLTPTMRDDGGTTAAEQKTLTEGVNEILLRGKAENGTESVYRILAIRLPAYSPESGPAWPPTTEPPVSSPPLTTAPVESDPPQATESTPSAPETDPSDQVPPGSELGRIILTVLLSGGAGVAFGFFVRDLWHKKYNR